MFLFLQKNIYFISLFLVSHQLPNKFIFGFEGFFTNILCLEDALKQTLYKNKCNLQNYLTLKNTKTWSIIMIYRLEFKKIYKNTNNLLNCYWLCKAKSCLWQYLKERCNHLSKNVLLNRTNFRRKENNFRPLTLCGISWQDIPILLEENPKTEKKIALQLSIQ